VRHTKRCRGDIVRSKLVAVTTGICSHVRLMLWDTCATCGAWLPLGPSDETPVAIEVRALEIFDSWPDGDQTDGEDAGWRAHMTGGDPDASPSMLAGWLAREIWLGPAAADDTPAARAVAREVRDSIEPSGVRLKGQR
jgi:hypothetical protein